MQVGKKPTERSKAKIYPEEYHLEEMEERLLYEEAAFAADIRGKNRPVDLKLNGNGKTTLNSTQIGEQLEVELWS